MNALCFSGGLIQSRQISCVISAVIYVASYHFIAVSTSYLNAGIVFFSACDTMDRVYRGWEGGGGVGAVGGHSDSKSGAMPSVCDTDW